MNEIQEYAGAAIKGIGDALFADGDIISGCTCVIDELTGQTSIEAGKVYLQGMVRDIHAGEFSIPIDRTVRIGVYFKEREVTELDDPELRDPGVGHSNYQEAGAARLQYVTTWGYQAVGVTNQDSELGDFYTIYNVENGVLVQKALAPQMESVNAALARYDNESNGSYVVNGMKVSCLSATNESQLFSVNEGKAHINGYEVELLHAVRSRFDNEYDLQRVDSDPYVFTPDGMGNMRVDLNYAPLHEVLTVDITAQNRINLTHGSYSGALDPIPSTAVLEIVQIKQDNTIYTNGTDYKLTSGQVDWSLSGAEPAPGSTYEIIYRYRTQVQPTNIDSTGFTVTGAVSGSMMLISYTWKMPRYDLITIDADGIIRRIKGLAHPWSPAIPKEPNGQLVLASVYQDWMQEKPTVTNNAIRVVRMSDLESMRSMIKDLYYLIAQLQLKNDANASDPTSKKGIFVDPFYDDDMRDQGVTQTGAIVDNKLILPIRTTVSSFAKDEEVYMLPYELEAVVSQEYQTGSMKINPYNAFDPIPADVTLTLNVDYWTEIETKWLSGVTYTYSTSGSSHTSYSTQIVKSDTENAEFMRQVQQHFKIEGMRPGEVLTKLTFDNVDITDQLTTEE